MIITLLSIHHHYHLEVIIIKKVIFELAMQLLKYFKGCVNI